MSRGLGALQRWLLYVLPPAPDADDAGRARVTDSCRVAELAADYYQEWTPSAWQLNSVRRFHHPQQ